MNQPPSYDLAICLFGLLIFLVIASLFYKDETGGGRDKDDDDWI